MKMQKNLLAKPMQAKNEENETCCQMCWYNKRQHMAGLIKEQQSKGYFKRCIKKEFHALPLYQLCWIRLVITNVS